MDMEISDLFLLRMVSAALLCGLLLFVHKRLHRSEISFTLGVVWSLAIGGALILSLAPSLLSGMSSHAGAELPVHFLFFMVQFFLVLLVFGLTLKSAKQERQIIRLSQDAALLRLELEQSQAQGIQYSSGVEKIRANQV